MALKFEPRGPVFEKDGTKLIFKRVNQAELTQFNLDHNPFKDRTPEEKEEIKNLINNDKHKEIQYTDEELLISLKQIAELCVQFIETVENLEDGEGNQINFDKLDNISKFTFFEEMYNHDEDFRDFILAFKLGTKKKFTILAKD